MALSLIFAANLFPEVKSQNITKYNNDKSIK